MTNSARAAEPQSSAKGKNNGQSDQISQSSAFWFALYEGIFEHAPVLKDSVWLLVWLIARTTEERDGKGIVLGGAPIHDERIAGELGFPIKTVRRWRRMLLDGEYISVIRTPYGFRYTVLKSKRRLKPTLRELPKRPISTQENGQTGQREPPQQEERVPETGISKKTIQRQYKEEAEQEATASAPSPKGESKSNPHPSWEDIGLKPCGTPKFSREWEGAYDDGEADELLVDLMESAIRNCQAKKIPVPPPFFLAKRRLEDEAKNHPDPDRDGPGPPERDLNEYAKKLNEEMEARWVKEGKKPFLSHPVPE
jgi:hypothetical protein